MEEKNFTQKLLNAVIYVLINLFFKVLIILPIEFWFKSIDRLNEQRENGTLSISVNNGKMPFFSFLKKFLFEFLFDAAIFLSYFIGIIVAIYSLVSSGFGEFIATIIAVFYLPVMFSWFRDLATFLLLPLEKAFSWLKKPAQHMDLTIKNKD